MINNQYVEKFNELYELNIGYGKRYKSDKELCDKAEIPPSTFASYKHVLDRRDPPTRLLKSISSAFGLSTNYLYLYWLYTEGLSEHNPDEPRKEALSGFIEIVNSSKIIVNSTEHSSDDLIGYLCKKDFNEFNLEKDDILICKNVDDNKPLNNADLVLIITTDDYKIGCSMWTDQETKDSMYVASKTGLTLYNKSNDRLYKAVKLDRKID